MSGYPKELEIQINIDNYKSNFLISGLNEEKEEVYNYEKSLVKLVSTLNNFRKTQISAYKYFPLIRFIYGRQFNFIYNILKEKEINKDKLSPILAFLTNNLIKNELENFAYKSYENIYEDMINNIERFLEEILKKKYGDSFLYNIYNDTLINENSKGNEYKGVYLYLCDNLEKDLFQIYKYLTKNNPYAHTILLCNK